MKIGTFIVTWSIPSIDEILSRRPAALQRQYFTNRYAHLTERSTILQVATGIGSVARHCSFGDPTPLQRGRQWWRDLSEDARVLLLTQLGAACEDLLALAKGAHEELRTAERGIKTFFEMSDDVSAMFDLGRNDEGAPDWDLDQLIEEYEHAMLEARKHLPQWLGVSLGLSPHLGAALGRDKAVWWAPLFVPQDKAVEV